MNKYFTFKMWCIYFITAIFPVSFLTSNFIQIINQYKYGLTQLELIGGSIICILIICVLAIFCATIYLSIFNMFEYIGGA
jgi:hypothetical protein